MPILETRTVEFIRSNAMADRERHPATNRELVQQFAVADRNDDGRIDFEEFRRLMQGLDEDMSVEELRIGFHEVDIDRDGLIDCREFIEWWTSD
jgi:Ca2+-binding EF-hand superfamily protein